MKILFIGESWAGSSARALNLALRQHDDIVLDEINEDLWFPKPRRKWLRAINRLTRAAYRQEFNAAVMKRAQAFRPDILMVYKGNHVHQDLINHLRAEGVRSVNIYPDYSPHTYGEAHRKAIGTYDLVISTKQYHPDLWHTTYGYDNRCVFVPHGYDPAIHLRQLSPIVQTIDVGMIATWRAEYGQLMREFAAALDDSEIRVAIAGNGWENEQQRLPAHWQFLGETAGPGYVETLRSMKICMAPLTRRPIINGKPQPGDVDTTRSYELAASHCFFIHHRTDYARKIYDEATEVPMFDDATELAAHVRHFLAHPAQRMAMAAAAHNRAVPAYSIDQRAQAILDILRAQSWA